jgi:O-antigen ligase
MDLMPKGMLMRLMDYNPALAQIYYYPLYRDGLYRANSIFLVSLSFGEFMAMIAPIASYFILEGRNRREQVLGIVAGIFCLIGLFSSGARGGYVAFLVAMPVFAFLWTVRYSKLHPASLATAILRFVFTVGTIAAILLVLFWPRLNNMVLGDSDGDRILQWNMALPHIIERPITGHGMGTAGEVVGYGNRGDGVFSVDSYVISTLIELGVPGFMIFFGMIAIAIWIGLHLYLTNMKAAVVGPLGCCLIAFAVYRLTLSQQENHTLVFIIIGLMCVVGKLAKDRCATMQPVAALQEPRGSLVPASGIVPNAP